MLDHHGEIVAEGAFPMTHPMSLIVFVDLLKDVIHRPSPPTFRYQSHTPASARSRLGRMLPVPLSSTTPCMSSRVLPSQQTGEASSDRACHPKSWLNGG